MDQKLYLNSEVRRLGHFVNRCERYMDDILFGWEKI